MKRNSVLPLGAACIIAAAAVAGASEASAASPGPFALPPQIVSAPAPAKQGEFSRAMSLSADDQHLLVTELTGTYEGKVHLYQKVHGAWRFSHTFLDPDNAASDEFGTTTAISADGATVLIGSWASVPGKSTAGKAYLYGLKNGSWTLLHEFDDPLATTGDGFYYVAMSGDGKSLLIGAPGSTANFTVQAGVAYAFDCHNGTWSSVPDQIIPDPDLLTGDAFGTEVTMSHDGASAAITSAAASGGKVFIFSRHNGQWTVARKLVDPAPVATTDGFGGAPGYRAPLAFSGDGATLMVASPGKPLGGINAGMIYVYHAQGGAWPANFASSIPSPDPTVGSDFGSSLAVSADGTRVLAGSSSLTLNGLPAEGKAYYLLFNNSQWVQPQEFAGTAAAEYLGDSLALSADGQNALIGALGDSVGALSSAGTVRSYTVALDLAAAVHASPASPAAGQQAALDVTVVNNDSIYTATNLTLTITLPAGMTYQSANAAGGSCDAGMQQQVTCTLAALAPRGVWQPSIDVSAASAATYQANVAIAADQGDTAIANNSAMAAFTVQAPASGGGGTTGFVVVALLGVATRVRRRKR